MRKLQSEKYSINKSLFIENIQHSLRNYKILESTFESQEELRLESANFAHHAEIYDIVKLNENGVEESMFIFFEKYFFIVIVTEFNVKLMLSPKIKSDSNYPDKNILKEFKKFLENQVDFTTGSYDEIIILD